MIVEKTDKMREIRDEVINLTKSPLYKYRTANNYHAVLGEGSYDADIIFIGEAPGKTEAETGRPFCGRSGKLLDEMFTSIGMTRSDIYITNIVKDRPQENRDPTQEEIDLYGPFLDRQIEIIEPKVIATLGRFSMEYIMRTFGLEKLLEPISRAHGKAYDVTELFDTLKVVPLYHPAAALYTGSLKEVLAADFQKLKKYIEA